MNEETVLRIVLPGPRYSSGKVRETYTLTGNLLLMAATDRISAFDVVLPTGIPGKGSVLNLLSAFWFEKTGRLVKNHLVQTVDNVDIIHKYFPLAQSDEELTVAVRRSMIVKRLKRLDVECVVRGYLAGSAWAEYKKTGEAYGYSLPKGMQEGQELSSPLFTPTTKADAGHDEGINMAQMAEIVGGKARAEKMMDATIAVYNFARTYAQGQGIIIADTKMEFGLEGDELVLIDELLTPDSSRFWEASRYKVGQSQPSYDKQPVRDWLSASGWNKQPPAPPLPREIVLQTMQSYAHIYERLTGKTLVAA